MAIEVILNVKASNWPELHLIPGFLTRYCYEDTEMIEDERECGKLVIKSSFPEPSTTVFKFIADKPFPRWTPFSPPAEEK